MNYYDFENTPRTCKKCGWVGSGKEAAMGESFGFIAYPLLGESLTDPRADPADRMFAEIVEQRVEAAKNKPRAE